MTVVKEMLKERVRRVQVHDYVQNKTSRRRQQYFLRDR